MRILFLVALLGYAGYANACDPAGQKVVAVLSDQVATYDDNGDFVSDVPRNTVILNEAIIACRESPSLVKVKLAENRTAWVDRLEVKVSGEKVAARPCKTQGVSRNSDTTTPASSGIDPCTR